ncbi:(S)-mandelate dehydrogenase [Paraburkholderia ultramafica]|uniref:(S)-mandelate dehydrogenase n=1 Tax=Paraburkholderia ultramafica TaxID=1544867 RepID=A0A6S7BNE7_9BURK|nr:alpha-hydroxy acid oxidase [Paraburkholderia ultramafica]CAB3806972.1 (S)-mandelate dehydrogenase [Paraburkholderia ultramafica]
MCAAEPAQVSSSFCRQNAVCLSHSAAEPVDTSGFVSLPEFRQDGIKMQIERAVNIQDLAVKAKRRLPKVIWDFMEGGAEDELTLRWNRQAFERVRFRQRVVTGNGRRDLSITLFGQQLSAPYIIAPTGLNGIYWPDADLILSRVAAAAGVGFVLSTASNNSIEEVARTSSGPRFFQMYPWGERSLSARLMERAANEGYSALIITVDSLIPGNRERDTRNHFAHSLRITPRTLWDGLTHPSWLMSTWLSRGMPRFENISEFLPERSSAYALAAYTRTQRNPFYSWADIAWVRLNWHGPLLIKGVLTAEDTRLAFENGADGVVVSNHGGRALDGAPATLDVLEEIVEAARHQTVLVDSGFRRGSDIVKALALGATGVLLGRAALFGLAAGGEAGIKRTLDILREETDRVMGLIGVRTTADIGRDHVEVANTSIPSAIGDMARHCTEDAGLPTL